MLDKLNPAQSQLYQNIPNISNPMGNKAGESQNPTAIGKIDKAENNIELEAKKKLGQIACETCSTRRYVDDSDDSGVSFQSPTRISPEAASAAAMGHEKEHYNRENAKAERENRDVIENRIQIFRDVCPECGKSYVSGGLTTTVTRAREEKDKESFEEQFFEKTHAGHFATKLDERL